jgi:hypothetical protein
MLMRTAMVWPVATVLLLVLPAPATAAPPTDIAAYCSATYPQVAFQVRCINVENAAAARVARASAAVDRTVLDGCLGATPSWAAMERCLARSSPGGGPGGSGPGTMGPAPSGPDAASIGPAGDATAARSPEPGTAEASPPSTGIPGPLVSPAPGPPEQDRPARPISEADAERHLRSLLERVGATAARCTKKQYGPGWVSICE